MGVFHDLTASEHNNNAIAAVTARTVAVRARFSNEWNARPIDAFVRTLSARRL
jgi:hypothetical protein